MAIENAQKIETRFQFCNLGEIEQSIITGFGKRTIDDEKTYKGYMLLNSSIRSLEREILGDKINIISFKLIIEKGIVVNKSNTLVKWNNKYHEIIEAKNVGREATILYLGEGTDKL